ncbi:hypothetical protein GALMADRAFT_1248408 [Galerina marginata CBS 339.88]|uniref:Uncharacterized protein n=1 Tax=Galerina marginata (strain CBS 339.88) TaxID=685588 RepID=A0A067S4E6_GALM3|nr:hypothetical protein GALMADRAFT_1248408 [Galerina marginata CBS 339.88]
MSSSSQLRMMAVAFVGVMLLVVGSVMALVEIFGFRVIRRITSRNGVKITLYVSTLLGVILGVSVTASLATSSELSHSPLKFKRDNTVFMMFLMFLFVGVFPLFLLCIHLMWISMDGTFRNIALALGRSALGLMFKRMNYSFWEIGAAFQASPV